LTTYYQLPGVHRLHPLRHRNIPPLLRHHPPSPPHLPPLAAASIPSAMSEPTTADLAKLIETLTMTVASLQTSVAELQKEKSASSSGGPGGHDGQHHHDRPPRFQKMDFPRYDGKTDPRIFTNRCESYILQVRGGHTDVVHQGADGRGHPVLALLQGAIEPALWVTTELAECQPTGTVAEYQDWFQALLPHVGLLTEAQRVQLFTGGL
jgi:hypothetical protein